MKKVEIMDQIEELIEELLDEVKPSEEDYVRQLRRDFKELERKLS